MPRNKSNAVSTENVLSSSHDACLEAVHTFLDAFRNLDWEPFCQSFAEDATFFFPPTAGAPRRANDKIEIEKVFARVFATLRQRKDHPPYVTIDPKDLRIQILQNAALVTFHLQDPDGLCRRTIVLENRGAKWQIVHVHASNLPDA